METGDNVYVVKFTLNGSDILNGRVISSGKEMVAVLVDGGHNALPRVEFVDSANVFTDYDVAMNFIDRER